MPWFVYIIKCNDGKLYTGITNNLERIVREHNTRKFWFRKADRPVRQWFGFPYKPEGDGAASDSRSHSQSHKR